MKPMRAIHSDIAIDGADPDPTFIGYKITNVGESAHIAQPRPSRTLILAFVLLLTSQTSRSQTTIVAVRDANTVIIAADSLHSTGDRHSCKIRQCGDAYLAVSGLTGASTNGDNLELWPALLEACKGPPVEPKARVSKLEQAATDWLNKAISLARQNTGPLEFQVKMPEKMLISFALVGWKNGGFVFTRGIGNVIYLTGEMRARPQENGQDFDMRLASDQIAHAFLGHFEGIQKFVGTAEPFKTLGLIEGAKFLVTTMALDRPTDVGLPIDILRITKDGAQWIQRKPECEEQKAESPTPKPKPATRPTKRRRSRSRPR